MKSILLFFLLLTLVLTTVLWVRYGGGEPYPDLARPAAIAESELLQLLDRHGDRGRLLLPEPDTPAESRDAG